MITLDETTPIPASLRGALLTVGNFDGVHRGHGELIARLRTHADRMGVSAVVLTFDPHPVALLRPDNAPAPLVWIERKVSLLKAAGADAVGVFRTGPWLLGLTAAEFFERIILSRFAAKGMVEGPNFAFGRDRRGDPALLSRWCAKEGLEFEVVAPTEFDGEMVSSSLIRGRLAEGRVEDAARLLGRPYRLRGIVTHGAARGRGLGFPTANLDHVDTLIPENGVYAALAFLDGAGPPRPTATHIGPNVTFGEQVRKVEAHLIDFEGDLYGRTVELAILKRLRGTREFSGLDDLLGQIGQDVAQARAVCGEAQGTGRFS